jgi:uncharacterized protein YbaR (Trm112 family)
MAKLFIVTCPKCKGKFQCHYASLRHKDVKLICPYCKLAFDQKDSPFIEE